MKHSKSIRIAGVLWLLAGVLHAAFPVTARAGMDLLQATPVGIFTNVAGCLFQDAQLCRSGLSITCIPVWQTNATGCFVTNHYTPSVHRLLQVAANLCDAVTNRFPDSPCPPSVFRPVFRRDAAGECVWIAGYLEETDLRFVESPPPFLDLDNPSDRALVPMSGTSFGQTTNEPMVFGIPLVIGAKKGFPTLNKIEWQVFVMLARKLELIRPDIASRPHLTNQFFELGISNAIAIQAWNAYSNAYPRNLGQFAEMVQTSALLSNSQAIVVSNVDVEVHGFAGQTPAGGLSREAGTWVGYNANNIAPSFTMPVLDGAAYLPWVALRIDSAGRGFILSTNLGYRFPPNITGFPAPDFHYNARARVRYALWDKDLRRIVDYVNMKIEVNINIQDDLTGYPDASGNFSSQGELWKTNRPWGGTAPMTPTVGVLRQIEISKNYGRYANEWNQHNWYQIPDAALASAMFLAFLDEYSDAYNPYVTNMQAPFCPVRAFSKQFKWEANDPLVHFMPEHLSEVSWPVAPVYQSFRTLISGTNVLSGLMTVSTRYKPWPGSPVATNSYGYGDPTFCALMLKDPGVKRPDYWDFPNALESGGNWLGRIHRGTPWQTLYLKPEWYDAEQGNPNLSLNLRTNWSRIWSSWTGNNNRFDAACTMPTNDWHLASLLLEMFRTNAPQDLFSLNNPAAWAMALDGITTWTNIIADRDLTFLVRIPSPAFAAFPLASNAPVVDRVCEGLRQRRNAGRGGYFQEISDILATPELSVRAPWLNTGNVIQIQRGLPDTVLECVAERMLWRLRPDSVGVGRIGDGRFRLRFSGQEGRRYAVQVSTNLDQWTSISTNTPDGGGFDVDQPMEPGMTRTFYRTWQLPGAEAP